MESKKYNKKIQNEDKINHKINNSLQNILWKFFEPNNINI